MLVVEGRAEKLQPGGGWNTRCWALPVEDTVVGALKTVIPCECLVVEKSLKGRKRRPRGEGTTERRRRLQAE